MHRSLLFFLFLQISLFALDDDEPKVMHECGVAFVHLRKGEQEWALEKLLLLMQKQQNRGRDGAGIAALQKEGFALYKTAKKGSYEEVKGHVLHEKERFLGSSYLGHLRYATYAGLCSSHCQPFESSHKEPSCHFAIAGNFNMTNIASLRNKIEESCSIDTEVVLKMIAQQMEGRVNLPEAMRTCAKEWDGGYFFVACFRDGSFFFCRDPAAIRPGYYLITDKVIAAASEKSALVETFDVAEDKVRNVPAGTLLYFDAQGKKHQERFAPKCPDHSCVFERIYFSKGRDPEIYRERKELGKYLAPKVYKAIDGDIENTIFTYVPNTSLLSFQGITEEMVRIVQKEQMKTLAKRLQEGNLTARALEGFSCPLVRSEHLIKKRSEKRTFITEDKSRKELISKIYDISKAVVTPNDTLVVVEDSIVRGNTLKLSIMSKLIELNPKKIIIVSSAPPICYPDCYGIDMSRLDRLIAFNALVALLQDRGEEICLEQLYDKECEKNQLAPLYGLFSLEELSKKIAELITPEQYPEWKNRIEVIYQTVEDLHKAIPNHQGDWYFSGNYPTRGGYRVLYQSFLNWKEGQERRAY